MWWAHQIFLFSCTEQTTMALPRGTQSLSQKNIFLLNEHWYNNHTRPTGWSIWTFASFSGQLPFWLGILSNSQSILLKIDKGIYSLIYLNEVVEKCFIYFFVCFVNSSLFYIKINTRIYASISWVDFKKSSTPIKTLIITLRLLWGQFRVWLQ